MRSERRPDQRRSSNRSGSRGQSEVIGYVAVFTIVILLVGIVTTAGYTQLREVRTFERANGAEQAVERFASEVETLLRGDAHERAVEMGLGGGSLSTREGVNVTVTGHEVGNPDRNFTHSVQLRALVFELSEARIRYVAGAVIRADEGAVMAREPPFVLSANHTLLPLVDVHLRNGEIGGQSTVLLRASRNAGPSRVVRSTQEPYEVNLSIQTAYPAVWEEYLEAELATSCSRSGNTVWCEYTTDRLSVVTHRVDVTHES